MAVIYTNGHKCGGYFTASALDVGADTTSTVFSASNVQGVIEELSDILDKKTSSCKTIKNICVGTNPTTTNTGLVITWSDGTTDHTNYIDFTN